MFHSNSNVDSQGSERESLAQSCSDSSVEHTSRLRLRSSMGSVIIEDIPDTAMRFDVPFLSHATNSDAMSHDGKYTTKNQGIIPGVVYLLVALTVFSCQSSVFVYLNGLNPDVYTACNVLCSSSIFGVFFMFIYLFLYKQSVTLADFRSLSKLDLVALIIGSTLYSVVGPYLFYIGLLTIEVPMASIVQRLESINFLVLSYFALNTVISQYTLISAICTFMGVVIAVSFNAIFTGDRVEFPEGYLYILLSGYATSFSLLLSKKYLAKCNTGVIAMARSTLGAILFYALSLVINTSSDEFANMELWKYAMPYGFVYIFVGQVSWVTALAINPPVVLSVGINVLFCLNLAWSGLLLNVYPTKESWVGAGFIFVSILLAIYDSVNYNKQQGNDLSSRLKRDLSLSNDTDKKSLLGDLFYFISGRDGNNIAKNDADTAHQKTASTEYEKVGRKDTVSGNVVYADGNDVDLRTNLI